MNAEDCPVHRPLIDRAEANGIYYPWTCECKSPGCGAVDKADWDACGDCNDCNPTVSS